MYKTNNFLSTYIFFSFRGQIFFKKKKYQLFKSFHFPSKDCIVYRKTDVASLGNVLFPALINVTHGLYKHDGSVISLNYDLKYKMC